MRTQSGKIRALLSTLIVAAMLLAIIPLFRQTTYAQEYDVDALHSFTVSGNAAFGYVDSSPLKGNNGYDDAIADAVGAGAYAQLGEGETLTMPPVDLTGFLGYTSQANATGQVGMTPLTSETQNRIPAVSVAFVPQQGWAQGNDKFDARTFVLTFSDGTNRFDVKVTTDSAGTGYVSSVYNGAAVVTNQWINCQILGYVDTVSAAFINILRVLYDEGSNSFGVANGDGNCAWLGAASGFDCKNVTVSCRFEDYVGDRAGVEVFFLGGERIDPLACKTVGITPASGLDLLFVNDSVSVPGASYVYGDATGDCAVTVTAPDGSTLPAAFTAAVAGAYNIRYSFEAEGNVYYKNVPFIVKGSYDVSEFPCYRTDGAINYANCIPLEGYDASFAEAIGTGIYARLENGDTLTAPAVDLTGFLGYTSQANATGQVGMTPLTSETQIRIPAVSVAFVPQQGWAQGNDKFDARTFVLTFSDGTNRFDVKVTTDSDGTGYVSSVYNGAAVVTNRWINCQILGYVGTDSAAFINILRVLYDEGSNSFGVANGDGNCAWLGAAPGFDCKNVTVSCHFEDYVGDRAGVMIFSLAGRHPTANETAVPVITPISAVPSFVISGDTVTIPKATLSYLDETVDCIMTIVDADGTPVENGFVAGNTGYTVRYEGRAKGYAFCRTYTIGVLPTVNIDDWTSHVVTEGSSMAYLPTYPLEGFDKAYADAMGAGAYVRLAKDGSVTFLPIDMSGFSAWKSQDDATKFIGITPVTAASQSPSQAFAFAFVPQQGWAQGNDKFDARTFVLTFSDGTNRFDVKVTTDSDGMGHVSSAYNGVAVVTNRWINCQVLGYIGTDSAAFINILRVVYDSDSSSFGVANGLDNTAWMGEAAGFDPSEVTVSCRFEDYETEGFAGMYVYRIGNAPVDAMQCVTPSVTLDGTIPAMYRDGDRVTLPDSTMFFGTANACGLVITDASGNVYENGFKAGAGIYTARYSCRIGDTLYYKDYTVTVDASRTASAVDLSDLVVSYGEGNEALVYGRLLSSLTLTGGKLYDVDGNIVPGRFIFKAPAMTPDVPVDGVFRALLVFESEDGIEYYYEEPLFAGIRVVRAALTPEGDVTCSVSGSKPGDAMPALSGVMLGIDGNPVSGRFVWTETTLAEGTVSYHWTFISDDTNYENAEGTVTLTVNKPTEPTPPDPDPVPPASDTTSGDDSGKKNGCKSTLSAVGTVAFLVTLAVGYAIVSRRKTKED